MQLPKFVQMVKVLDTIDPAKLPEIVNSIKGALNEYSSDYNKLDQALFHLCQQVMRIKDIKSEHKIHYENLICEVIRIAINSQFRVGANGLRFVFNLNSQFYKNSNLEELLSFPIGRNRLLKQHIPSVGQTCDIVKPYITSTSVCGWTRCIVKQIQNNRYTVEYANSLGQTMTRETPWFAPLGSRMKDYEWRMALDIGSPIQALLQRTWYQATVAEVSQQVGCKKVRVTFRRFAEDGDRIDTHGNRFFGLGSGQDEWIQVLSPRIQQCGKMVNKKLCYYTFGATEQYIMEDQYDMIFQQQYKQKPFYAIARTTNFKSVSILTFVDYLVANKAIQKLLSLMDESDINDEIVFTVMAIIGFTSPILPRMYLKQSALQAVYHKIIVYLLSNIKTLNVTKIQISYFAYDFIGRRLFSLTEIHRNQNQLRKSLIKQFLKMNMQKQMLAVRYLNDLIHPKKPLDQQQKQLFHKFMIDEKVFQQIFNANIHEQILSRSAFLLNYMIKNQIISTRQFQSLWTIVPVNDTRGRATIQKLLTDISKNIPPNFVQILISKILQLKQTQLTIDNLNLLRELKNRQISNDVQMKILSFLWDILTVKSANIKTNIQEEIQKVFKSYISILKDEKIRRNVLQSMALKLQECKKIRNEIELLKDFIKSYPQKLEKDKMIQQNSENIPQTISQAVALLKGKGIYQSLYNLLSKTKDSSVIKDILQFFAFLFENDKEDVKPIIRLIYEKTGPSSIFLEWVEKLINYSLDFIVQLLQNTVDFSVYQNLNQPGFNALTEMILSANQQKKNLKIITTHHYKTQNQNSVGTGPTTGDACSGVCKCPVAHQHIPLEVKQQKDKKFIGPLLPEVHKHIYVLVSPFKLIGMKFLQHLLHVVKSTIVYNLIVKIIIKLITNLDESIQSRTKEYIKQFLFDILKQIKNITSQNKFDEQIKAKILAYINLFTQIFAETQKNGLGQLIPHFEKVIGETINLNIDNLFDRQKNKIKKESLPKFTLSCNQNCTIWSFKKMVSQIICEKPQNIDVIKYVEPLKEQNHGKSLSDLLFYDNESIKVGKKQVKMIPRASLLNEQRTGFSDKFQIYVNKLFIQYKNAQLNGLSQADMQKLSKQKWKGTLFKQKERLNKVFEDHDKQKKGYLNQTDFKAFFLEKALKNQSGVWVLINLSGFKNNFSPAGNQEEIIPINVQNLPRKILSCPEVYNLIFQIFENETFKQVHLNFYRLLCMLQVNKTETEEIQKKIYQIIEKQKSVYALCYSLQVINSELSKKNQFYIDFWKNNGVIMIKKRIQQLLSNNKSIYELDPLMKNQIMPGFVRVFNMYVSQLLWTYKLVRFSNKTRINNLELEEFVKKINQIKEPKQDEKLITNTSKLLLELGSIDQTMKDIYLICDLVLQNLIKNFLNQKSDYLSKLTTQIVRVMAALVGSKTNYHNFNPYEYTYGITNGSLNNRRSTIILIYIYLFHSTEKTSLQIEKILNKLLAQMPSESKVQNGNYFSLLNQIISKYLQIQSNCNEKDQFFISLGNQLLNKLFQSVQGESRTDIMSDKVILGILVVVETLVKKKTICMGLSWRVTQITQKCLFAYNIQQKLKNIQITEEMLVQQKQDQHFKNYVICKTEDSRNVAYNIVANLHSVSPSIQPFFFTSYILPIIKNISQDVRLTSSKSSDVGLKNFGSTCYMNSMLQVINSVKPFRNTLMKCESESQLIKQLKRLFASLFFSQRLDYAPRKLLTAFVPPINPGLQQDTTQFLNFLFDQLESALSSTKYKKVLDQIFKGANTVQMICHSCGYKKQNREQFFCFGVQIQGKFDLQSAMEGSYQGEIISDYLCDECKNRGQTTKRNILSQIPSVMFIHLRRIVFNYDMFVNMKIHTRLQFPEQLNIQPYTKEGVQLRQKLGLEYMKNLPHSQQQMKKFEELSQHGKPKDFYKMKLKGVIVHSGSADVGHYYSILPNDKTWRKYDDSRVTYFGPSSFDSQCYGGTFTSQEWGSGSSGNAYVLIYQKFIKNPLKIQTGNAQMPEQIVIQYDDVKIYNSPQDYREIWLDNHNFMVQNQLLQAKNGKGFINFLCRLLNDTPSGSLSKLQIIADIIYRISYHSGIVGDLLKIVNQNIQQVDQTLFYIYITSDKARTFKLLFNFQKPVRQFMASFLHIILIESYKKGDQKIKKDITAYIVQLVNSMTGQIAKNWLRIDGFLSLLHKLVTSSKEIPQLWNLFMEKRFISHLIDYVMQKQSPVRINPKNYSLGTKSNPMDFSYAISIIKFYLLHSYGFNGKNYEVPAIPESYLFHLNDNDITCLSYIQFYKKMLRERQNLADLAVIIQRLCIMNLQFSKSICEAVLQAIGSITDSKDQMQDLSIVVLQILKIRDDFWINRAQMLLGIGQPFIMNNNVMNTFDEERYVFSSVLYDIFPIQCLFSYVYLYRLKNTLATFQLMKAIIQGCSISDIAIQFLARQPSPSYLYPNYLTWMQNFIESFASFATTDNKVRQRLQGQVQYIQKYIKDVHTYMTEHPQVDYYQSLITGDIVKKIQMNSFEKDGIEIKLYEYQVYCVKSQPTSKDGNLTMDPYLQSSRLTKNVSENSNILKFLKKPPKVIALSSEPTMNQQEKEITNLFDTQISPKTLTNQVSTQIDKKEQQKQPQQKKIVQNQRQQIKIQNQIEQQVNINGVHVNNYFRQLQLVNKTKQKKVVRVVLNAQAYPNMIVPKQLSWKLFPKNTESIWMAKQNPQKDWGQLQTKTHVYDFVKQKHQKKNITSWWFKNYEDKQSNEQTTLNKLDKMQVNEQAVNNQPQQKKIDIANQLDMTMMNCPICTCFNPVSNSQCEVCGSPLHGN